MVSSSVQAAIRNVPKAAGIKTTVLIKQLIDTDLSGLEADCVMQVTEVDCPPADGALPVTARRFVPMLTDPAKRVNRPNYGTNGQQACARYGML